MTHSTKIQTSSQEEAHLTEEKYLEMEVRSQTKKSLHAGVVPNRVGYGTEFPCLWSEREESSRSYEGTHGLLEIMSTLLICFGEQPARGCQPTLES